MPKPKQIVKQILPTTMVGSYPRPHWFKHQLLGRDIRVAFKEVQHEEAYNDAVATVIRDQEEAGLDIVTDGNMWYDDYVGVIGSFCWYMYERIGGFEQSREPHPSLRRTPPPSQGKDILDDWGGVINSGPVTHGPIRLADLYKIAAKHATSPVKVSVGAGPANLAWHVYFKHYKNAKELSFALAPIFNKEMKDLVAAGAKYLQFEDLGAWLPLFTERQERLQVDPRSRSRCAATASTRRSAGTSASATPGATTSSAPTIPEGYQTVLPYFFGTAGIDEFVLDYANRDMAGVEFLKNLPANQGVQIGVLDIRTNAIETPEKIADRIRKVAQARAGRQGHAEHATAA